jgi:hypothetical protein
MKFPFKMDLAMRTARALMAPTPQVDSTPAATSLPDPQQLAEQVRASIAQALTNCREREREAGQKLEAALKQREVVATARAAAVIAAIPEKVRAETEGWSACRHRPKYQTMIMIIDNLESEPRSLMTTILRRQLSKDIFMTLTKSKAFLLGSVILLAAVAAAFLHLSSLRPGAQTLDCTWSLQVLLSSLMLAMNNNLRRLRQQRYISYVWAALSGIVIGMGLAASPSLTPEGAFGVVLLTLFFIP